VLISRAFFARPSVQVAPDLLGCVLEHQTAAGLVAVELTEVEAYAGEADPASHAYRGKTRRNAVMYGPPGHAYVYFTYGMHFCVNLVCLGEGSASAVLLRAGTVIEGEDLARARRTRPRGVRGDGSPREEEVTVVGSRDLARGPARLCQALGIDRSLDGADVCVAGSPLRIRWPGARTADRSAKIKSGPRVGIAHAAEVPWRFWLDGEPSVSAYRAYAPKRRKPVTP
jgi:DNA-3-methyladenine glycosylase